MSVTASQLSSASTHREDIAQLVHDHIDAIDTALRVAPRKWGRNVVVHNLPVSPAIMGLSKMNAQMLVYSNIIKSLEERGFEVRVLLESERTVLYIAWVTELSAKEVEAMKAYIGAKRVFPGEIQKFLTTSEFDKGAKPSFKVTEKGRVLDPRKGVIAPPADENVSAGDASMSAAEASILEGA